MRGAWLAVFALSACATALPQPQATGLMPDSGGLQPAGTNLRIDFSRAEAGAVETVSRILGARPAATVDQAECGAGPVRAVRWQSGLTLNFQDGDFAGWVVDEPGLVVAGGYRVGMAAPDLALHQTSLGHEFEAGGVFGLIDQAGEVAALWSGTTCFFR